MSVRYNRAKPFPKLLMTLLLPAVAAVSVYLVCVKMSPEEATSLHESFGNKLVRSVETDRLNRLLRKCDTNQSMLQFYREKYSGSRYRRLFEQNPTDMGA